ncbi:hypothetical protein FY528_04930 [Hymenobacter lutimineralis]|uniref:Bacteriophage Mx8 p63 C-terminal domain-containing protein n=1 Tax=Hymenobacter lutimineralis TaxID=2606448 RepID=A0A5D6V9J3_9BACT|nr:P63C domain-containing protein [Hymenobacter lutimineralis]TYZ12641.1 hypothetical protein FY528_04930 [Hymenobacter lutimineralis]
MSKNLTPKDGGKSDNVSKAAYGSLDKPLIIEGMPIQCFVLDNEERVIVQRGLFKALGITRGGDTTEKYKEYGGGARLARFLENNNIISLKNSDIGVALKTPIPFTVNGTLYLGYKAEVLQQIVRAVAKAHLRGKLPPQFDTIGANAEKLDDALAKVGITALVDEITGFQTVRSREALQRILDKYLLKDYAKWAKQFDDEFYIQMFRLKGWSLDLKTMKRPGVVGRYTNDIVYQRIAPGLFEQLQVRNPKINGRRKVKNFQYLSDDIGLPALQRHIEILVALMRAAPNWTTFMRLVNRSLPKLNDQLTLNLESYEDYEDGEAEDVTEE